MKKLAFILMALSLLQGCATIVKSPNQSIQLTGGLEDSSTKVSTPTGNFTLNGGATTILMPRTKADIPIEVTCHGQTQKTVVPTRFDIAWGGLGNLVFGGIIGWFLDAVGDKAWDAQTPFNVAPYCAKSPMTPINKRD